MHSLVNSVTGDVLPGDAPMTARKAVAEVVRGGLERLVHLGGAEALQAALPTNSKRMVEDGILPSHAVGAEPWVLTIERLKVALTWPDGHTLRLDIPSAPTAGELQLNRAIARYQDQRR